MSNVSDGVSDIEDNERAEFGTVLINDFIIINVSVIVELAGDRELLATRLESRVLE